MKQISNNQVVTAIHTLDDKILQNILTKVLAEEGLEGPTTPSGFKGVSNSTVELSAAKDVDFQNLQTEQADCYFITDVTASDDHICIADLIGILPIVLSEVHDKGLKEPAINSLGFPVTWWDYLELGTTDLTSSSDNASDVESDEYHMCIADLIGILPIVLSEVHDKGLIELNSLGFPETWWDYLQPHRPNSELDTQ